MADQFSSAHLTHDELDSVSRQHEDCAAVGRNLRLERIARAAAAGAPSLEFADFPREVSKRDIAITDAAAALANALHLHLD